MLLLLVLLLLVLELLVEESVFLMQNKMRICVKRDYVNVDSSS